MKESLVRGLINRVCQGLARSARGRRRCGRLFIVRAARRSVKEYGSDTTLLLDTSQPHLITLEDNCVLSLRVVILAHFRENRGVKIERNAFVGAGALILPNVTIGEGAVVAAGSVVTRSVPPLLLVQGNPAVPIAQCGVPIGPKTSAREFSRNLRPLTVRRSQPESE